MPPSRYEHSGRYVGGVPFDVDLLEGDLTTKYAHLPKGRRMGWGLAVAAVAGTWNEVVRIGGVDWAAEFDPPGELKVPVPARKRLAWRKIPEHAVLVSVRTDSTDINEARDRGRPAVRSLLALLRHEVPVLLPSRVLWEGAIIGIKKGRIGMTAYGLKMESARGISATRLHALGLRLAKLSVSAFPPPLKRSLEWLMLARSANVRSEKFMHLWLAVLTLASFGQPLRGLDMPRVRKYTATMGHGIGGVRSPLSIADLNDRLGRVYRIRNDLVHRADDSEITLGLLETLESDAFELIDFELAKLGTPIPAS